MVADVTAVLMKDFSRNLQDRMTALNRARSTSSPPSPRPVGCPSASPPFALPWPCVPALLPALPTEPELRRTTDGALVDRQCRAAAGDRPRAGGPAQPGAGRPRTHPGGVRRHPGRRVALVGELDAVPDRWPTTDRTIDDARSAPCATPAPWPSCSPPRRRDASRRHRHPGPRDPDHRGRGVRPGAGAPATSWPSPAPSTGWSAASRSWPPRPQTVPRRWPRECQPRARCATSATRSEEVTAMHAVLAAVSDSTVSWDIGYTIGVIVVLVVVALVVPILVLAHRIGNQAGAIDEALTDAVDNTAALAELTDHDRVGHGHRGRARARSDPVGRMTVLGTDRDPGRPVVGGDHRGVRGRPGRGRPADDPRPARAAHRPAGRGRRVTR